MCAGLLATVACRKEDTATESAAATATGAVAKTTVAADKLQEVTAKLAKADAYDGTTDKIVSKCGNCGLGIEGSSSHALEVAGYKMHFCSQDCREHFAEDAVKAVLALEVPGD